VQWFIGWGSEDTERFDIASGMKSVRDKETGGAKFISMETTDFAETAVELEAVSSLIERLSGCVLLMSLPGDVGKLSNNFHYENDILVDSSKKP
jgi:hypothetical protein